MQNFEPQNELETSLVAAQEGDLDAQDFMLLLLRSQVFMPVQDPEAQGEAGRQDTVVSLVLENDQGQPAVAVFTHSDRAGILKKDFPDFGGGLQADFVWILDKIGADVGMIINPGLSVGIDLAPEMLEQLKTIASQQGGVNGQDA